MRHTCTWALSVCTLLNTGCTAGLGAVGTHASPSPRSIHVGGALESYLHLPRSYEWVVGGQGALLPQVDPASAIDQWRVAIAGGYLSLPERDGSRFGLEVLGHVGFVRGSFGERTDEHLAYFGAWQYGAKVGLPLRLDGSREPWRSDGLVYIQCLLVPELGVSHLLAFPRAASGVDHFLEPMAGLALRFHVSSSLLP